MEQVKGLTEHKLDGRWSGVKDEDDWWGDVNPRMLRVVKALMASAMESEMIDELRSPPGTGERSFDAVTANGLPLKEYAHRPGANRVPSHPQGP